MSDAYILSGVRTPIGSLGGCFAETSAVELGAVAAREALVRAGAAPSDLDEVIFGNVLSAGLGQNPARQIALRAGAPASVGATTVNKVCGSGLKAVTLGAQAVRSGDARLLLVGGTENMSQAPYLLPKARSGYRMGHGELIDSLLHDGLWDVHGCQSMGVLGDRCADEHGWSRQAQDDFAVRSYQRARAAQAAGHWIDELAEVSIAARKQTRVVREDEEPARFDEAKLRSLRPAFGAQGSVTAGNASSVNDGAAALLLASADYVRATGARPLARLVAHAAHSREPEWFTLAPIDAIRKVLDRAGWSVEATDLFEVNEAFSVVALAAQHALRLPDDKFNIQGGAVAIGHPIGCSGARILVTLLHALRRTGGRRGVAALCIGGGEAVAVAIELIDESSTEGGR